MTSKMKYIRTKDGIYEVEYDLDSIVITKQECPNTEEFINQADTIEELCDEFVIISGEVKQIDDDYKSVLEWTKQAFEEYKIKSIIYGAIWTDKGLIYVAKMNDKGELELL